jgi:hypothetical protein
MDSPFHERVLMKAVYRKKWAKKVKRILPRIV